MNRMGTARGESFANFRSLPLLSFTIGSKCLGKKCLAHTLEVFVGLNLILLMFKIHSLLVRDPSGNLYNR